MLTVIIIVSIVLLAAAVWMARVLDTINQLPPPLPPQHPDNQPPKKPFPAAQPVQRELVREFSSGGVYEVSFRKKDGTVRHYSRFLVVFEKKTKNTVLIDGIDICGAIPLYFPEHKEMGVGAKQAGFTPEQVIAANEVGRYSPSQMKLICELVKKINIRKTDNDLMELYDLIQLMERE